MFTPGGGTELVVKEVESGANTGAKGWFPVNASNTEMKKLTKQKNDADRKAFLRDK